MNFRAWTVFSLAAISTACGVLGEDTESATDDVTVTPTGTSTLGTLEIEVPAGLTQVIGTRALNVAYQAAPGSIGRAGDFSQEAVTAGKGSVRIPPGTYCLRVISMVGHNLDQITTEDCSVVVPAGGKRTYSLGKVVFRPEDAAFLQSQGGLNAGGPSLLEPTDAMGNKSRLWSKANEFAAVKSTITTIAYAGDAGPWAPVVTEVGEGETVNLGVPTNDRIVRFKRLVGTGTLSGAFADKWSWRMQNSPSYLRDYERSSRTFDGDLAFFTDPNAKVVFELGGLEREFPMSEVGSTYVRSAYIEVTDVTDTDDEGKVTTVQGSVSVQQVNGPVLKWGSSSSFTTGHGVWVWPGSYSVRVSYVSAGQSKVYEERVDLN